MKNLFKIDIFTYLLLILSFFAGYFREMLIVYLILFVHEMGHFFLMRFYNIEVNNIIMYPYGGMIKSNMLINTKSKNVLLISLGGIICQIILWGIIFILYRLCFISDFYYGIFFKYNISIILFNLIPIYPLDGFKILNSILEMFISFKYSVFVSLIICFISLIMFFYYLYLNSVNNYIIVLFMLFSLFKYIKELKYILNKFYIERVIYDINYNGLKSISDINYIYKNKYNYINGVEEKKCLKKRFGIYI